MTKLIRLGACVWTEWNFLKSTCHSGYTVLAKRAVRKVAGDLVPWECPDNLLCGSLCISMMWLLNLFLLERTVKQELNKLQNGTRGIWPSCPPRTPCFAPYPHHPSSSPASPPCHHHPPSSPGHPPPSPPISGVLEALHPLPPLLQGHVGQALGCLHTGLASSLIRKV